MDFDEVDLNLIYDAIDHKIRTTQWNVSDESEFEALTALKGLQTRILKELDGILKELNGGF